MEAGRGELCPAGVAGPGLGEQEQVPRGAPWTPRWGRAGAWRATLASNQGWCWGWNHHSHTTRATATPGHEEPALAVGSGSAAPLQHQAPPMPPGFLGTTQPGHPARLRGDGAEPGWAPGYELPRRGCSPPAGPSPCPRPQPGRSCPQHSAAGRAEVRAGTVRALRARAFSAPQPLGERCLRSWFPSSSVPRGCRRVNTAGGPAGTGSRPRDPAPAAPPCPRAPRPYRRRWPRGDRSQRQPGAWHRPAGSRPARRLPAALRRPEAPASADGARTAPPEPPRPEKRGPRPAHSLRWGRPTMPGARPGGKGASPQPGGGHSSPAALPSPAPRGHRPAALRG